jgi:nickel-dependent lactate racemase
MTRILISGFCLILAATFAGCGDGSSSIDPNKKLADLTAEEQKSVCDEIASLQGGYGRSVTCTDGHQETTNANQAECVSGFTIVAQACSTLTVGDVVECSKAQGQDLCKFPTVAECAPVRDCLATL